MIMIVEDDTATGGALERALRCAGFEAVAIPSAMEALTLIHLQKPQMFVLDVNLPGLDGISMLRSLRRDADYAQVPVLIYSSEFSLEKQREAMNAGAQEYIVKGTIGVEALIGRIRGILEDQHPRLRMSQ